MVFTVPEVIVTAVLAAGAIKWLTWTHRECKRQQLQELQAAREAARAAEMLEIKQRIYAEITRNKTMQELKVTARNKPIRKATGLFSDEAAQALWK